MEQVFNNGSDTFNEKEIILWIFMLQVPPDFCSHHK